MNFNVTAENYDFSTKEFIITTDEEPLIEDEIETHIRIPLDFVDIIDNPNSDDNLYLVDGDSIVVTRNPFTVIVEGEVNSPMPIIFEKGKTNLIIGQSGSGKTVFIKCLLGLFDYDSGSISYEGKVAIVTGAGGGISSSGTTTITDSIISNNSASGGGGHSMCAINQDHISIQPAENFMPVFGVALALIVCG